MLHLHTLILSPPQDLCCKLIIYAAISILYWKPVPLTALALQYQKILCYHKAIKDLAQMVKNLPSIQENRIGSLSWKDPLEKGIATHSSILAWRIPLDRGAWQDTMHRVAKSRTRLKWLSTLHVKPVLHFKNIYIRVKSKDRDQGIII